MKLKIKQRSELVMPLTLRCGMTVNVRRPSAQQRKELNDACSRDVLNRMTGRMEKEIVDDLWNTKAPDFYIAGWEDFTPDMLPALNIEVDEPPSTNGDGLIAYDRDLARQLWVEAANFAVDIIRFADQMLQLAQLEKKSESITSSI